MTSDQYERENITGLGSLLDAPRSALWNLGRSTIDTLSGEGDWRDALPGLLGILGGGAAAATGIGIPAAILMGSGLAGASQAGLGNKAMAPDEYIEKNLGDTGANQGLGFLLSALTDPLSAAGIGMAGKTGSLGRVGRAADARVAPMVNDAANAINQYRHPIAQLPPGLAAKRLEESTVGIPKGTLAGTGGSDPLRYGNMGNWETHRPEGFFDPHAGDPARLLAEANQGMAGGKVSSPEHLDQIVQSVQNAGLMPRSIDPAAQLANRQAVMSGMEPHAIEDIIQHIKSGTAQPQVLFPGGQGNIARRPQVDLGEMFQGAGGTHVPMSPEKIIEALQQNPEAMKALLQKAAVEEGAFKAPARARNLPPVIADAMGEGSLSNFLNMFSKRTPLPGG